MVSCFGGILIVYSLYRCQARKRRAAKAQSVDGAPNAPKLINKVREEWEEWARKHVVFKRTPLHSTSPFHSSVNINAPTLTQVDIAIALLGVLAISFSVMNLFLQWVRHRSTEGLG